MPITTLTPNPWRYKEDTTGHSSGFEAEAFDDSAWAEGNQAFGKNDLSYEGPIATPWPGSNNDLCARGHFTVPAEATGVRVKATVDFEGEVFVNGVSIGTVLWSDSPYKTFVLSSWDVGDNLIAVRAHADDQQNRLAVLVDLVYPDEPVAWDVFSADDLNGPPIATLTTCPARFIRVEEDGEGFGSITVNRHDAVATEAILARGNLVRVRIPEVSDDYIFAFFLEQGDFTILSSNEEGDEELTFTGRGALSYLGRARMWNEAYTTGLDVSDVWDEVWHKSMTNPVGSAVVSTDQGYVYVINATDRKIRKVRQSDRVVVRTSPALWSGADNYAAGLGADPSDDTILWVLEAPWSLGGAGNTKIRKVRISDWAILDTFNLGSAVQLTAIKASSTHLWTSKWDGPDLQKRSKTDGSVVTSYSQTYNGDAQVNATGISVNGTRIAMWYYGKSRALISSTSDPATVTDRIRTTGLSAFGGDWTTEGSEEFFYPVSYTADTVWKYQLTSATPHDPVDGIWRLDEATPGAILARIMDEITAGARPQQPVPALTYGFTYTTDTDGNPWDSHPGTEEFTAAIGDLVDEVVLRLVPFGLTLQMSPALELQAYNEGDWGTNRASATFASGKVRVEGGINAAEGLRRRMDDRRVDSHMLVQGDGGRFATAEDDDLGYVREGFTSTNLTTTGALEGTGEAELARQRRDADAQAVVIPWGDDEVAGLYMPGPPGSNGHYWVGDTIRVHTGSGEFDLDEQNRDVKAITIEEVDQGEWVATADLQAVFFPIYDPVEPVKAASGGNIGGTSGAGSGGGSTAAQPITVVDTTNGESYQGTRIESDDWGVFQAGTNRVGVSIRGRKLADLSDAMLDAIADGQGIAWDADTETWIPVTLGAGSLGWFNVRDYGAVGDGVTNDTAAIQAAIDACAAAGGGIVYFPPGHYIVSGALQDTGDFNGQLLLPEVDISTDAQVTIHFLGALKPEFAIHGPFPSTDAYSIIESTLTGASGTAAVFSGGNGTYPVQNNVQVVVENLICLAPTDPSFTFWNLSTCQGGSIRNVLVWLSAWANPATSPTHSNAYGVKLPQWAQSNYTHVDGLMVACFYTGVLQGELAICRGLVFGLNVVALELPESKHSSLIVDMHQTGCTYGIRVTGTHACDVLQFSTEHYTAPLPAWTHTVYDLDDPGNDMLGYIRWYALDGITITPDHIFNVNGGSGVEYSEVGEPWVSGAPPTGAAGGGLSGTYPNPSVVDDSHSHTSATAPGAGGSGIGPILVTSVPAGSPLVFADLLQNSEGTDLLYASEV